MDLNLDLLGPTLKPTILLLKDDVDDLNMNHKHKTSFVQPKFKTRFDGIILTAKLSFYWQIYTALIMISQTIISIYTLFAGYLKFK